MTDFVNREVESSTPLDQQQRRPDGQKFDDDVAQKEGDGWLSEDAGTDWWEIIKVLWDAYLCVGDLSWGCISVVRVMEFILKTSSSARKHVEQVLAMGLLWVTTGTDWWEIIKVSWDAYLCVGDLFESCLPLIGEGSIQVADGTEGRRRHAMYSKCFTPTAVRRYYDVYNQVILNYVIPSIYASLHHSRLARSLMFSTWPFIRPFRLFFSTNSLNTVVF